jgi:halocyanin-like protein
MMDPTIERRALMKTAGALPFALSAMGSVSASPNGEQDRSAGERIWSFETGEPIRSSPTIVNKTVYFGADDGNVYALDAETGEEEWRFGTEKPPEGQRKSDRGVESDPKVVDGTVYVGANDNYFYALDAETGDERWRYEGGHRANEGGGFVWGSPSVVDGVVYGNSRSDHVYALDAETGDELWRTWTEGPKGGGVTVADGRVYSGSYLDVNLHAFDAETGEVLWEKELESENCASPLVHDGVVYGMFAGQPMLGFDAETGEEVFRYEGAEFGINGVPTIWNDTLYATAGYDPAGIHAVDVESGEQEWHFEVPQMIAQVPTVADGVIFAGSYRETNLFAVDAETGEEQWRFETHAAVNGAPNVVDGVVFFGTHDGYLHAVDAGVDGSSEDALHDRGINSHHHGWVGDPEPDLKMVPDGDSYEPTDGDFELPYGDWLAETPNYQGTVDMRQREYYDAVTIEVGAGPDGLQFDPPAVLVEPGQNIEFEWTGEGGSHNTVEETGLWESELVDESGHTYPIDYTTLETDETRLTEAGVHRYECLPHSDVGMRGAIVVGDIDEVIDDLLHYSVTDADIDRETVESGDTVVVTAEIDVAWIGTDERIVEIELFADDEQTGSKSVSLTREGTTEVTFEQAAPEPGAFSLRVEDTEAGTLTVETASTDIETPTDGDSSDQTDTGGSDDGETPAPAESDETATPSGSDESGDSGAAAGEPTATEDAETSADGPGFGVAGALGALSGLSYVLERRLGNDEGEE